VDPEAPGEILPGVWTLTRINEPDAVGMKPLADPISVDESRALADRLLKPYLPEAVENREERPVLSAIVVRSSGLGGSTPTSPARFVSVVPIEVGRAD
jgi:hypothetical protein